jgi:hypothetical protein
LEQENRALRDRVARAEPESDDAYLSRIKRAGGLDQSSLPSAVGQIETSQQKHEREENGQFAASLARIAGDEALGEGFRSMDDGRRGGYGATDLEKVAQDMNVGTLYAQNVLQRAAKGLPEK